MPTINKRFLLRLILVLVAFTGALFGAHAVQSRRIPAALKQQSERAAENGKLDMAVHYLRQYLEFHPEDADSQVRLAELLAKRTPTQRGYAELLFLYDKILRLDPDRDAIRREALAVSLKLGKFADAVTHGEPLVQKFPQEPALWQQLGAAHAGLNKLAEARRCYEAAVAQAPHELIGYQRLAQLVWKNMDDANGARAVLDRMVKALPQDPGAYLIRARFESFLAEEATAGASGDLARASADLHRVFELDPESAEATVLLADIMQRKRNLPAAHALLRDGVALYPKNLKLIRGLSWLELLRGNPATAITVLEDGLKVNPDGFDLLVPLADLLVQQGDTTRTAEILRRLEARKAPATQVNYLKARVAMRAQQWQEAVTMIERLRGQIANMNLPGLDLQLNLLLATCFRNLGDPGSEEKAYRRVTSADPKNVPALVGLGNLYLNLGRFEDAARELDEAVQSPYATGAVVSQWVRLKTRLARSNPREWSKLERPFAPSPPNAPKSELVKRFGPSVEPVILYAEILTAQGRLLDALKLLRQEAAKRPGDGHLWSVVALSTADLFGTPAGLAIVDEAQAAAGDCVDLRLARATLYAREPGRVRPIEPLAERIESWPESEQLRLLAGLVEVFDRVGDRANVVRTLRRMVGRQPANVELWVKLHERAKPGGADATGARAALVKLEGETGLAVALCDAHAATAANASALADRLARAFGANPTRSDACLALARVKRLAGDAPAADALTERAFVLEPTQYECAEALLAQHTQGGISDRAGQFLSRLANDPRWAGEPFRRMVGHVLPALPQATGAALLARCRPLVEGDPGGPAWLAECAVAMKLPEAAALLDTATQRSTASSDDWLRKALFVSKENPPAGQEVLSAARARLAPALYYALVAVYCDSAAGSTFVPEANTPDEKRALAQARLSVKLSRSQFAEGGKILEAFLAEKDIKPTDADWARRNAAMIHAVGGTPEDRVRAMTLLKDVAVDATSTPDELRVTASVLTTLARYLEGPDRRAVLAKAIVAMEGAHKATNSPKDLFTLTQLHRAIGDRRASRLCFRELLNKDPENPYYLIAALDECVEDGDFASGSAFAAKLTQAHAGDFRALAAVARYECKAGRPERGLAVAEGYARAADAGAGDYMVRSARVAELLDELSRLPNVHGTPVARQMTDAAVERFASVVPNRPEAIVGVAGALAADGRAKDAFDRIERLDRYIPARIRASAGLAIVRGGTVSDKQGELVQKWLDACLADEPESVPLLLNKAEFLTMRHDLTGAATMYEKVLTKESRNVVALNNLAWLLASDPKTAEKALELVARATRESGLNGELLDTRARVRITLRQYEAAGRDLTEAITHQPSALRWFHVALLRMSQTPPAEAEAAKAFAEAKRRGLEPKGIHPADLPTYRVLDAKK